MSNEPIVPYRVYSPAEAAELLRLPLFLVQAAIRRGELVARTAGGESRLLGQALINYLMGSARTEPRSSDVDASPPDSCPTPSRQAAGSSGNTYNLATSRGGKDDLSIESALQGSWDALRAGEPVHLEPGSLKRSHWNGSDQVDVQDSAIVFLNRRDHSLVPVAIKATTRVLHRNGVRGRFEIGAWDEVLTIKPLPR
jgi:hypothetical protein